ncbi:MULTISPECIES: AAA family ATPase [unclassified Bradyrhizobium]
MNGVEYGKEKASAFLAQIVTDYGRFEAVVDAILDARKEAGLTSAFLCQPVIDRGCEAAAQLTGSVAARIALKHFKGDDDFVAIATLLDNDPDLGEDMLLGLALEGFDHAHLFALAIAYNGFAYDYLNDRHPNRMREHEIGRDVVCESPEEEPRLDQQAIQALPTAYALPRIDLVAKYDSAWLGEAFFASDKSRSKIEGLLADLGISSRSHVPAELGHRLADFRYRHPILKKLRDEAAAQYASSSPKHASFTLFPGPQRAFDRAWRSGSSHRPYPDGSRWKAIAHAVRSRAMYDPGVAEEAFLAQVAEADIEELRDAREFFSNEPSYRDFISHVLIENAKDGEEVIPPAAAPEALPEVVTQSEFSNDVAADVAVEFQKEDLMSASAATTTVTARFPSSEPVDHAWAETLGRLAREIQEAAHRPPNLDFIMAVEASCPVLRKLFEDHVARSILPFGEVRDRVLPLLIELRTVVPASEAELDRSLAEIISRIEAVEADVAWTRQSADEASSLAEAIADLQAKAKASYSEVAEYGKQIGRGRYEFADHLKAAIATGATQVRETCDFSTRIADLAGSAPAAHKRPELVVVEAPAPVHEPVNPSAEAFLESVLLTVDDTSSESSALCAETEAELARIGAAVTDPEVSVTQVQPPDVPDFPQANTRILELAAAGSFSTAYHLAAAVEACRGVPVISSFELRLVATAPYLNLPAMQVNERSVQEIRSTLEKVLSIAQDPDLSDNEIGIARRLLMFAGAIGPALLGRDSVAIEVVRAIALGGDWDGAAYGLKEALTRAGRGNAPITIERCRLLASNADAQYRAETAKTRILNVANQIATKEWPNFQAGTQIAKLLSDQSSEIGEVVAAVKAKSPEAIELAREFATNYHDTVKADELLQRNYKAVIESMRRRNSTTIVGSARSSFMRLIVDFADACAVFVATTDAASGDERANRQRHMEIRDVVLAAITATERATKGLARGRTGILDYAVDTALAALDRQRKLLNGVFEAPSHLDHLFALYGPLAAVPGMVFSKSWLPGPHDPAERLKLLMEAGDCEQTRQRTTDVSFLELVSARIGQGSFGAANLLVEMGDFLGVSEKGLADARGLIQRAVDPARARAIEAAAEARRALESLERIGDLREQELAASFTRRLDLIDVSSLPLEQPAELRTEELPAGGVEPVIDIAGVLALTEEIRSSVHAVAAKYRNELLNELKTLLENNEVDHVQAAAVRSVIEKDNNIIGREWLDLLKRGIPLPVTDHANIRLSTMFPTLVDFAAGASDIVGKAVYAARDGRDFGPLLFSQIGAGHRAAASDFLTNWYTLGKTLLATGLNAPARSSAAALNCLRSLGVSTPQSPQAIQQKDVAGKFAVTFEISGLNIPLDLSDRTTMVLPDFGSATGGHWKIMVAQALPSDHDLDAFTRSATTHGRLIFVCGAITADERRRLLKSCRDAGRKVLVVDDAIMLAVASERRLRPATMIELAQPFSYAEPFDDHGKSAVPPEMFVGRANEIQSILSPTGTNIVYGGRRLGKTALLRHIANTQHDPASGMMAFHVDVLPYGTMEQPAEGIWRKLSSEMSDIFRMPVDDARAFQDQIAKWLIANPGGRILLMIDEADNLIESDARSDFRIVNALVDLMAARTNRGFKVVLAGLHNVTRLANGANNAVIKQISHEPICIGPFIDLDLAEAERLLTRPLAALGYEFETRDLAWRILTRASYIPSTLQLFGKRFLSMLGALPLDLRKVPPVIITAKMVHAAFSDPAIEKNIVAAFRYTVENDRRYQLLVNIIAENDYLLRAENQLASGMSSVEIGARAADYWPNQFVGLDAQQMTDAMLEEMQGLGLVKRLTGVDGGDRWTLRSPQIRSLLGSLEKVQHELLQFVGENPTKQGDLRAMRRFVRHETDESRPSALTWHQEEDYLHGKNSVQVVVGSLAAGIHDVTASVSAALEGSETKVHVFDPKFGISRQLLAIAADKKQSRHLLVVPDTVAWKGADLTEAVAKGVGLDAMTDGKARVRAMFVATPDKFMDLIGDPSFERTLGLNKVPYVRGLHLWNNATVDAVAHRLGVTMLGEEKECLRRVTGYFGAAAFNALSSIMGQDDKTKALETWFEERSKTPGFLASFGLRDRAMLAQFKLLLEYGELVKTTADIRDVLFSTDAAAGSRFITYTTFLGLITAQKAGADKQRRIVFNPVLDSLRPMIEASAGELPNGAAV